MTDYMYSVPSLLAADSPALTAVHRTLTVPENVMNKYQVEVTSTTPVSLLAEKISSGELENEEAFYVVDLGVVLKKYQQWINQLPRVKPFYAVKCNPNPAIVRTLAFAGANFDCASKAEIQQVLGVGVEPSRIIYANPTKMKSHIQFAKSVGVDLMTFDNEQELVKMAEVYPDARLVLRIITDDSHSICRFSTKFGAPLSVTRNLLVKAKQLGLNVCGVSFHVGSGCMSSEAFANALESAARVFKEAEEVGHTFTILDLGGGWPGSDEDGISFSAVTDTVRECLDKWFPSHDLQIIGEPGRYMVAESHTLAVNVFAKREMLDEETQARRFLYYVNDGVYQSFNCIFFDHAHPRPNLLADRDGPRHRCTIFGPTCDSMDCIGKDLLLPELEVGEWLYFKGMGAYTVAAASPFNGFSALPTTFYIFNGEQISL